MYLVMPRTTIKYYTKTKSKQETLKWNMNIFLNISKEYTKVENKKWRGQKENK